jgi:hypothetical protein
MIKQRVLVEPTDAFKMIATWNTQIRKMHRHITSDLGYDVQDIPAIRSALGVWKDISKKIEEIRQVLGYLVIDNIIINQAKVTFDGQFGARVSVDAIVTVLKLIDYVESVERRGTAEDPKTKKFKFGLTLNLKPTLAKKKGR